MIKILAETPLAHQIEQLHIARGDDAHVDLDGFRAAQAHELALLDHAQQLGLRLRTDRGNFVEENRALIGDLKKSFLRGHRAGEGALHVPEELRFEQIHGNRSCY